MSAAPFNVPFVIHEAVADCGFRVRHDASTIGTSLVVSSSSSSNNVNNNNGSNNSAAAADLLVRLLLPLQDSTALLLLKTYSTPTPATSPSSSYIMLYGHSAPISAPIVTARVEMEDPVLGLAHNCFLTAAENGYNSA